MRHFAKTPAVFFSIPRANIIILILIFKYIRTLVPALLIHEKNRLPLSLLAFSFFTVCPVTGCRGEADRRCG